MKKEKEREGGEKRGQKRSRERKTKERVARRAMITRCSRYNSGQGWRPFTCVCTRWMVNVKPRVSLAWPPRRQDHNAWSSFSQADHDHGDPTFFVCSFAPSSSSLPTAPSSSVHLARYSAHRSLSVQGTRSSLAYLLAGGFFVTDRYALPPCCYFARDV